MASEVWPGVLFKVQSRVMSSIQCVRSYTMSLKISCKFILVLKLLYLTSFVSIESNIRRFESRDKLLLRGDITLTFDSATDTHPKNVKY